MAAPPRTFEFEFDRDMSRGFGFLCLAHGLLHFSQFYRERFDSRVKTTLEHARMWVQNAPLMVILSSIFLRTIV